MTIFSENYCHFVNFLGFDNIGAPLGLLMWGHVQPSFGSHLNPIPTRGGRLCPLYNDVPTKFWKPQAWRLFFFSVWDKVEIILKVAWIWSHHLHLQWKYKLLEGKFAWGGHCQQNFESKKFSWHHPAMFCLITSSILSCQ